jgi:XTP/dITP diphosphohydrolase
MRRFDGARLLVATHNRGKLEEIAALFAGTGIELVSAADLGLVEPPETEDSFVGNARIKAHAAAAATGLPALADDSGLCVDALGGLPGVWSADWAETPAGRDFGRAIAKVCRLIGESGSSTPHSARFVCTLVLAWPDGHDDVFEGHVAGEIVCPGRGYHGHGYDPIFLPAGHSKTFGEMDRWEKNRMSHRGRAFASLLTCFT